MNSTINTGKRVAITGGAGFIGSQLGYKLNQEGWAVLLIDDMSYGKPDNLVINGETFGTFIKCDVRSPDMLNHLQGVDVVVHFAGIAPLPDCQGNPMKAIDVNVGGLANTLECARKNNVKRFVFSSTSAMYENNETFPSSEKDVISPYLIYAVSKQQGELLCRSYLKTYGLQTVVVRFFNVYGPHQDFRRKHPPFLGYTIRELMCDRVPTFFNDGTQRRDYVYVGDVCSLVEKCMTDSRAVGGTFNAASGQTYSVNELFNYICSAMKKGKIQPNYNVAANFWERYPELFEGDMPLRKELVEKEVKKYAHGSNEWSKERLDWVPQVSIEEGIQYTVDYCLAKGLPEELLEELKE